jgi:hypothetical protein
MIEDYDDLMELMDQMRLADKYNNNKFLFNDAELTLAEAQGIVDEYMKGGVNGG